MSPVIPFSAHFSAPPLIVSDSAFRFVYNSLLSLIRIPSSPQYPYNTFVRDKTTAHTALVPEGASQDHPPSVSVSFQALPYQDAKRSHFSYLRHAHFQSEPCCP